MHELRYGTSAPDERAEIVSLRTTVTGVDATSRRRAQDRAGQRRAAASAAFTGKRAGLLRRARLRAERRPIARAALLAGNRITGPALIEEHASTTVLMPGDTADRRRLTAIS